MTTSPQALPPNTGDTDIDDLIGKYARAYRAYMNQLTDGQDMWKCQAAIQAAIEQKLAPTQLESDRVIFKMLHKFADELIADHDNFSGRDNSSMITGRYAMKIKDAVNAELQATKDEK